MVTPRFYIQKHVRDGLSGGFKASGAARDLEKDFPTLRYKSCAGLDLYGEAQVYTETFAEDERSLTYVPGESVRKSTEITLTLYFFGCEPGKPVPTDATEEQLLDRAQRAYDDFFAFISGGYCCYWDNVRKKKAMLYQVSAPTIGQEKLYGMPYKQVAIKFKNVYGRTFRLDDPVFTPVTE